MREYEGKLLKCVYEHRKDSSDVLKIDVDPKQEGIEKLVGIVEITGPCDPLYTDLMHYRGKILRFDFDEISNKAGVIRGFATNLSLLDKIVGAPTALDRVFDAVRVYNKTFHKELEYDQ